MHYHSAWGQWAVELLQRNASLPGGSEKCNTCNAQPHRLGTVDSGSPAMRRPTRWGGQGGLPRRRWLPKEPTSSNALPHCLGAVGTGTHVMHCLIASRQWAVQFLQYTASLLVGSG